MKEWWDPPQRGRNHRWLRWVVAGLIVAFWALAVGLALWLAWAVL